MRITIQYEIYKNKPNGCSDLKIYTKIKEDKTKLEEYMILLMINL